MGCAGGGFVTKEEWGGGSPVEGAFDTRRPGGRGDLETIEMTTGDHDVAEWVGRGKRSKQLGHARIVSLVRSEAFAFTRYVICKLPSRTK